MSKILIFAAANSVAIWPSILGTLALEIAIRVPPVCVSVTVGKLTEWAISPCCRKCSNSVTAMTAQRLGYQAVSFKNITTSVATIIAKGSKVEVAGALFSFPGDQSPQASTWTAIATSVTAYLTLLPTGSAGTQTLITRWTDTAPIWSRSKQGFYTSTGSTIRHVGSVFKNDATSYLNKFLLDNSQRRAVVGEYVVSGVSTLKVLLTKVIEIGDWNMDVTTEITVIHGMGASYKKIRNIDAIIRDDDDVGYRAISSTFNVDGYVGGGFRNVTPTVITLSRRLNGSFDGALYDSTSYNRGWIYVVYDV